jgi:hypothetical protein
MRRFLLAVLLCSLLGCQGFFVESRFQPIVQKFRISGFVDFVELSTITKIDGTLITITVVTFFPPDGFLQPISTISFCGNLINEFFIDVFTTVEFTRGLNCDHLLFIATDLEARTGVGTGKREATNVASIKPGIARVRGSSGSPSLLSLQPIGNAWLSGIKEGVAERDPSRDR